MDKNSLNMGQIEEEYQAFLLSYDLDPPPTPLLSESIGEHVREKKDREQEKEGATGSVSADGRGGGKDPQIGRQQKTFSISFPDPDPYNP